jgi:hypothetical protein
VVLNTDGLAWEANATRCIDFYVTTTPATFDPAAGRSPYAELLLNYVDAVGHAPTMPYYATGFIQCKDRYRNQSQLLEVARGYVERGLPIAVIVIDWKHWVAQVREQKRRHCTLLARIRVEISAPRAAIFRPSLCPSLALAGRLAVQSGVLAGPAGHGR